MPSSILSICACASSAGSTATTSRSISDGRRSADRYAALAAELVRDGVDIIVTSGTAPALAAKKATKTIPIVVAAVGDPIRSKLVKSLARPGGNVTGMANGQTDLAGHRLNALHKVVPGLKALGDAGLLQQPNISLEMEQIERKARRAADRDGHLRCPTVVADRAYHSSGSRARSTRSMFAPTVHHHPSGRHQYRGGEREAADDACVSANMWKPAA